MARKTLQEQFLEISWRRLLLDCFLFRPDYLVCDEVFSIRLLAAVDDVLRVAEAALGRPTTLWWPGEACAIFTAEN